MISHADDNLKHNIHYNQMPGALALNSSSTSPYWRQNCALMRKKWRWPTHTPTQRVRVDTTQEKFRCGYYIIPKIIPVHSRASQTLPSPTLCSLLPLISTPGHPHLSASFPYPITLSNTSPISPALYLLYTPSCRVYESWHELHAAEHE